MFYNTFESQCAHWLIFPSSVSHLPKRQELTTSSPFTPHQYVKIRCKNGGQPGNADARKHAYNARVFTSAKKKCLQADERDQLRHDEALHRGLVLRAWYSLRSLRSPGTCVNGRFYSATPAVSSCGAPFRRHFCSFHHFNYLPSATSYQPSATSYPICFGLVPRNK
jgi:hypothetical protein